MRGKREKKTASAHPTTYLIVTGEELSRVKIPTFAAPPQPGKLRKVCTEEYKLPCDNKKGSHWGTV